MIESVVLALVAIGVVAIAAYAGRKAKTAKAAAQVSSRDRDEALFVAMFPELQPHFHPEKVVAYVRARRGRTPARGGFTWKAAPGFGGPAVDIRFVKDREECSLVDAAGSAIAQFRYESLPSGGVLRLGSGKITVDLSDARNAAVRYWHPEREFKWSRRSGWRFKTPVAEQAFASTPTTPDTFSSDSSSTERAVAATPFAGRGGTFDGGGASGGWEAGSKATATHSPGGNSAGIAVAATALGASALVAGAASDHSPQDFGGVASDPSTHDSGGATSDHALHESGGDASEPSSHDSGGAVSDSSSDDSGGNSSDTAY